MIILWSLEAYPDLITGIEPEDRSQIQEFVEKKLLDFAKGNIGNIVIVFINYTLKRYVYLGYIFSYLCTYLVKLIKVYPKNTESYAKIKVDIRKRQDNCILP
jgi:hypothetical protein